MPQRIQAPDGSIVEFPDGMSDGQIAAAMRRNYGGPTERKRSVAENVSGALANFNRTLGVGDELAAGVRTAGGAIADAVQGRRGPGLGQRFRESMGTQREIESDFARAQPKTAALARGMGMIPAMALPGSNALGTLNNGSRAINAVRGAVAAGATGAAYAAADEGTVGERLQRASGAATNPLALAAGGAFGALAPAARRARPQGGNAQAANVLRDIGVSTTIPQRMGGIAKQTEDLAMRAPILGPAISATRSRQVDQLNRGIGLKALAPIGRDIPRDVKPGFEMVEYVDDALGEVYDRAAKLAPSVRVDKNFMDDLAEIATRKADLDEGAASQFDRMIDARLARLNRPDLSGEMVKAIHSELGKLQGEAAKAGKDTLAGMIGDTRRALIGVIERVSPEAREMLKAADEGWGVYSIMNDAAAKASNRGGVFLPGQLNTEVRSAGRRMGSNMTGKGKAPLQDIATAATSVLPDQFGNPGTANAVGLGGLAVGLGTEPASTLAVAGGLAAAATPYMTMARKITESLPGNASRAELQRAAEQLAELSRRDPAVVQLQREVTNRLARASGVAANPPGVEIWVDGVPGAYGSSAR